MKTAYLLSFVLAISSMSVSASAEESSAGRSLDSSQEKWRQLPGQAVRNENLHQAISFACEGTLKSIVDEQVKPAASGFAAAIEQQISQTKVLEKKEIETAKKSGAGKVQIATIKKRYEEIYQQLKEAGSQADMGMKTIASDNLPEADRRGIIANAMLTENGFTLNDANKLCYESLRFGALCHAMISPKVKKYSKENHKKVIRELDLEAHNRQMKDDTGRGRGDAQIYRFFVNKDKLNFDHVLAACESGRKFFCGDSVDVFPGQLKNACASGTSDEVFGN